MTFLVPFDGSELAETALVRAGEFATVFDEQVVAAVVIPEGNASYARERDWIGPDEPYDTAAIVSRLRERTTDLVPEAELRHVIVDRYAPVGTIAKRLRTIADHEETSLLFVGSENAGRVVSAVSSVGGTVSNRADYDIVVIRNRTPSRIAGLESSPGDDDRSGFYSSG